MITITLDFETYYDVNYSLTKMPTPVYVNHDDFKVWGVGIKVEDQETVWLQPDEIEAEFATYNWEDVALVCHNTPFDAYILTQRYGIQDVGRYYDTAAMSRGLYPSQSASLSAVAERLWRRVTYEVEAKSLSYLCRFGSWPTQIGAMLFDRKRQIRWKGPVAKDLLSKLNA